MSLDKARLAAVDDAQRARYDARLEAHGRDPRTLGWGDAAQMQARFAAVTAAVDPAGREVLDVGCGFGDLLGYLEAAGRGPRAYTGWDINPRLVDEARRAHPSATFEVRNILLDPPAAPVADLVFLIGVTSLRIPDLDPAEYFAAFLDAGFAAAREALVVNGISAVPTPGYPQEDFIAYRHPADLVRWGLERTPRVDLHHAAPPIPQREFTLVLWKEPAP